MSSSPDIVRLQEQIVVREVTSVTLDADIAKGSLMVPPSVLANMHEELFEGQTSVFVGESSAGEPRGQASIWWETPAVDAPLAEALGGGRTAYVAGVWTRPEYEGRGVARTIMHHLETRALDFGITGLYLDVAVDNGRGRKFWCKQGYRSLGRSCMVLIHPQSRDGVFASERRMTEVIPLGKRLLPNGRGQSVDIRGAYL